MIVFCLVIFNVACGPNKYCYAHADAPFHEICCHFQRCKCNCLQGMDNHHWVAPLFKIHTCSIRLSKKSNKCSNYELMHLANTSVDIAYDILGVEHLRVRACVLACAQHHVCLLHAMSLHWEHTVYWITVQAHVECVVTGHMKARLSTSVHWSTLEKGHRELTCM